SRLLIFSSLWSKYTLAAAVPTVSTSAATVRLEGDAMEVRITRAYDMAQRASGAHGTPGEFRALVDRLWPRGLAKAEVDIDEWCKDVAPTTELRRWYGHVVDRFDEFAERYEQELDHPPAAGALAHLEDVARTHKLTLVTATRDVEHSAARVLYERLTGTTF